MPLEVGAASFAFADSAFDLSSGATVLAFDDVRGGLIGLLFGRIVMRHGVSIFLARVVFCASFLHEIDGG